LLSIAGIPSTANPGQQLQAFLQPPLSVLNFVDVELHDVDLDLIAKDVVFANKNLADPNFITDSNIVKILPLFNLLSVPPSVDNSGVPGLIGKLKGKLPVAIPKTEAPSISVRWRITDDNNNPLVEGTDFLAPGGLTNPTLDITFLPAFSRFDGTVPAPSGRKIFADVTLSAGTTNIPQVTIGPARILIPTIPFPKVLAMTVDTNFQGAALIVVPDVSPIAGVDHIKTLLQPVRNVINTLTTVASLAEMLTGINILSSILDATNIVFTKATTINNLNDITLIQRAWYENDTEAEDELSSLIYISPPPPPRGNDNKVELCNARDLGTSEGKFTLSTGTSFVAICNNLHSATPSFTPSTAFHQDNAPAGWRWFGNITTFGDEISSLHFL
jgi:hypothetical protein